jgi:hypothetical protein
MDDEIVEDSKSEDNEAGEESARSESPLTCSGGTEARSQRADSEATDDDSEEVLDPREKFLIFTMGSRTYTPHQIGFYLYYFFKFSSLLYLVSFFPQV